MLRQRVKLWQLIRVVPVQQRQQTNSAGEKKVRPAEWEKARPFKEIPKVGLGHFAGNMLPGGRYHNLQFSDILLDLRQQHGPLYRLPAVLGKSEFLVSNDPKHFEPLFRAVGPMPERPDIPILNYHRKEHQKEFYKGIEGLLSTQGEDWSKFRSAVNPVLMQPKVVRLYYQKMSSVNMEFIQRIREIRDASTFEVPESFEEEINRWTLESVSVVALDKQLGLIKANRNNPQAKKLFDSLTEFFITSTDLDLKPSIWRYVSTPKFKRAMKALDNIQDVTVGYVNEALERLEREPSNKPEHDQSVLEKLIKIDKKIATVMAMDMLMAGVDTTSSTFFGVLLNLAKNPEKQAKLREEVFSILPNKDSEFTEASMKNVPYLRACIKESLRIYPLTVGNSRVIKSDVVIDGYQVPKDTPVMLISHGQLTDELNYLNGKAFVPERWLRQTNEEPSKCPEAAKATNPFLNLPFGYGARMCIGKRIAEMELELGIARLIRNYHVEFNYPADNPFKSLFINVPNIPLKFKFTDVEQ